MAERCQWCGCGEMLPGTKRLENGRTLAYECCTWCGHVVRGEGRRPTTVAETQARLVIA